MTPRPDAFAAFVAVAETRSFVGAARRLRRSPAAVTRAIAALERHLSARLFNRTTRAVALTDAGRSYLDVCRRLFGVLEELNSTAVAARDSPAGTLRITAPVVFGRLHVLPVVSDILHRHPRLAIELSLLDRPVSLVEEGLDVAVRLGRLPDSSLVAVRAGEVRRVLCASPDYLAANGVPASPRDLAKHATIAFTGVTPIADRWTFRRGARRTTVPVAPRLVANTAEAAIDAARAGHGFVCVLSYQADPWIADGSLVAVLADHEPPPLPIQVVRPAGRYGAPAVRLFLDRIVPELRRKFGG